MHRSSPLSRLRRPALAAALCLLFPLTALAETDTGSSTGTDTGSGSTTEGSASNGSTTEGSASNGSTTEGSASNGGGTTSYDSPNVYDLGGGTVTLATAILNGGTVTNGTINASAAITGYSGSITANLTGAATLTKSTADTLILAGANSYTGGTGINAGTLQIGNGGTLGNLPGNVTNDAALVFNRSDALAYSGVISGSGSLTQAGSGTLTLSGANTYSGGTTVAGGILQIGDGGSVGSIIGDATNNGTILFNRSDDYTYAGVISGTGQVATVGGILRFSQAQTYTGNTSVLTGFLVLSPNVDQGLSASTKVDVATGAFFDFSNRSLTLAGLTGGGTVYSFGGSSGQLTVNTAVAERQTFSGVLGGSFPDFTLTKTGAGTLVLAGANGYTGPTTVSSGSLLINGSLSNTATTVASGGTLGGTGTINALTTIQSGGILAPGDSVGTLTLTSGLTLNAGAVLNFDLGTTSDLLVVNGGFLTGPSGGNVTLNLADAGGFGAATYTLFNFTGATLSNFDASDFTLGTTPSGWNYAFDLTADSLQLTVSAVPEPATYAAMIGALALGLVVLRRRQSARL